VPISREEFEEGRIDFTVPIAHLLAEYPNMAFSLNEIHQMLTEIESRNATLEEVEQALEALVSRERVQSKDIAGQRWYAMVQRRLGFLKE
jgi:hypothetical protein